MNWEFLTGDSWGEFAKKYPEAYAFILHKALVDEVSARRFELFSINSIGFTYMDERKNWLLQRIKTLEEEIKNES